MKSIVSTRISSILMTIMIALVLFTVGRCSKDSGRSPGLPRVSGHYVGSGSYVETAWESAPRLNLAWIAELTQHNESTFVGTLTGTFTDPKTTLSGETMEWGVKGTVRWPDFATIAETSMAMPKSPGWIYGEQQFLKDFDSCRVSVEGDTISYSGPSPELERFVLVRQR